MIRLARSHLARMSLRYLCLPSFGCLATAQIAPSVAPVSATSEIRGVLHSTDGVSIEEAQITVTDTAGRTTSGTSKDDGNFALIGLIPGARYQLQVAALGFARTVQEGVVAGAPPIVLTLTVDRLQESITVFSDTRQDLKESPELSRTLNSRELTQLPSASRSLAQFAILDPRARNTTGSGSDGRTATRLTINNQSFRFTQYQLDGGANFDVIFSNGPQQSVSLSAIGEFKLLTNLFPAQYGRSSAGIVLVSTKSGKDELHGEVFAFIRPSGIQAAPPLSTFHVPNEKLQWGSTAGGPINRGKTYFLVSYEQLNQNRSAFIQSPAATFFEGRQDSWMGLTRLDKKWNDREFTTLRINGDFLTTNNLNDNVGGFVQASAAKIDVQQSVAAQVTQRSVFATWLNDFRFSFASALPLWNTPVTPSISIVRPSYSTTGGSATEHVRTQTYQVSDTVSKSWRSHSFVYGSEYIREYTNNNLINAPFGTYTFAAGPPTTDQKPLRYSQTVGISFMKYGQDLFAAFLQDDWRLSSRLTTNIGLRYDFQSISAARINLQPRLGVAWRPFSKGDTIVRAGAGLFYDQIYGQIQHNALNLGPDATTASYTIANPSYPTPPLVGGTTDRRDLYLSSSTLRNPYTMEVSAGIEQRLPAGFLLQLDAVYMASRHQIRLDNLNAPTPFIRTAAGQTRATPAANSTRPSLTYRRKDGTQISVANVEQVSNSGDSRNTSGEVQISRYVGQRFQFFVAYLLSSNITDTFFTGGLGTGTPNVWGVDEGETGPSDYFQRHRIVATGIVNLPLAFRLSGTTIAATGLPVNPLTGIDNDGDGIAADRPYGLSRNSFRGKRQLGTDIALARTFHLYGRLKLESRIEAGNIFNHNNFVRLTNTYGNTSLPVAGFLIPQAGIQNSDPSRQIQFGARLLF